MADMLSTTPLVTLPTAAADQLSSANVLVDDEASPPSSGMDQNVAGGSPRPTPAPVSPSPRAATPSLAQGVDEEAGAAERREKEEKQLRNAKAKANLEAGAIAVVFGFAVLIALLCLPSEAKHPSNTRITVSLLLAFGTFVSGNCLMFLSMNMIGLRRRLVSGVQSGASQCLFVLSVALSTMTLVSLLVLLPGRIYLCAAGLAMLTVVAMLVTAAH